MSESHRIEQVAIRKFRRRDWQQSYTRFRYIEALGREPTNPASASWLEYRTFLKAQNQQATAS